jgi:acetyltransferase-like isoleucine patch superfamily enzyme
MKYNNRNIVLGNNVIIGNNVKIGDNTIIYDNVEIGDNTIICNDCVIGEPQNSYYFDEDYKNPSTFIGSESLIRSHCIFYAGSKFGSHLVTGHRVIIREETEVGDHCQFGSFNDIQGYCKIGNYVKLQSYVNIGQKSIIGNFVFIYPFVVLTNDPVPPSNDLVGSVIGDYSQVTSSSVILPGTIIGKHCLVSANSTVSGSYADDSFISGNPATFKGKLSKMPFFNSNGKRHYPWPINFKRGMPWSEIGYENWLQNDKIS